MRILCSAKDSHIFSTKNDSVFVILMFENFNETLTNDVVSFEQLGPEILRFCVFLTEYVREEIVALLAVNFNSYFNQTALEVGGSYWLYERSFLYYYFLYIFFKNSC